MEENRTVELTDTEVEEYLEIALAEQFTKPGTANVSAEDRKKLAGLLKHYAKMKHPFTACKRDQMKHGLSEDHANRRCAVLKDLIHGSTRWRGKDKDKKNMSEEELAGFRLVAPDEFYTWLSEVDEDELLREAGVEEEETEDKLGIVRRLAAHLLPGWKVKEEPKNTLTFSTDTTNYTPPAAPLAPAYTPSAYIPTPPALAYRLPYELSEAKPAGERRFKKTLLHAGRSINYGEKVLSFTRETLQSMVENFKNRAFDQVPLLSHHPKAPEQEVFAYLGELADLDIEDNRLVGTFKVTQRGEELLKENPRLGTSAGYLENFKRDDGKHFKGAVLQHVATTFKPRVNALEPWELVEMSSSEGAAVDLTEASYDPVEAPEQREERDTVSETVETNQEPNEEVKEESKKLSLAQMQRAIELANERAAAAEERLKKTEESATATARALAEQKVESYLDEQKRTHGVPRFVCELARPLLLEAELSEKDASKSYETIELSADGATKKTLEFGEVVKRLVEASRGKVDLAQEEGSSNVEPEAADPEEQLHRRTQALMAEKQLSYGDAFDIALGELSSNEEVS